MWPHGTTNSGGAAFHTTHWSLVAAAVDGDNADARAALDQLCRIYWRPLYAFIRRRGYGPQDAQDLTQSVFEHLLQHRFLTGVQPAKGRFRSYLLAAVKHFLANEWHREQTQKRGGQYTFVPLEAATEEARYGLVPADGQDPEKAFDRQWALTILERVVSQLGGEYKRAGKAHVFEHLRDRLMGDQNAPGYAVLAGKLGLNEGAARMAVSRLRGRFRELVRAEIARTVLTPAEVDEEIGQLFAAFSH